MPSTLYLIDMRRDPSDRTLRRVWGDHGWREIEEGLWVPTAGDLAGRLAVREAGPAEWHVLVDGTVARERDGSPLVWPEKFAAGYDAFEFLNKNWHGPGYRFSPELPWVERRGWWMRPLAGAYRTARGRWIETYEAGETPVAVLREWQFHEGKGCWGVFAGSAQRHALVTIGLERRFATAEAARQAADNEVGCWVKTDEWGAIMWRRNRRKGWWPPRD